jgi:alpha-tubulin suppressor-like RCC1 family protein
MLFTWGTGPTGQLGNSTLGTRSSPVQIGSSSWTAVSAGNGHTLAIRSGGTLFAWGAGSSGQIGNSTQNNQSSPIQIGSSSWTAVSNGGNSAQSFAIRSDGLLFAWGSGTSGALGDGTATVAGFSSPVQIGSSSWTAVSMGTSGARAIKSGGVLYAWGLNTSGQQGDSTLTNKSSPTAMGNNLATQQSSPVQIGSSSWTAVSSGFSHAAAIRSGGTLFTWGVGGGGGLGDGTTVSKSSPVQIGSSSWTAVSLGGVGGGTSLGNTVAIRSGGTLFAWGYNIYGQIGDNTSVSKSSPVQIGSSSWTAVSACETSIAAIRLGGTLFTWGNGTTGQLGDGTAVTKSSPVQIGSSSWTAVSAGVSYTMGILS